MKRITVLVLVIFLGLFCISPAVDARLGGEGHGSGRGSMGIPPGKWWQMPQVAEKLSLTEGEKEKMDAIYLEHRRQMIDLRSQVERERLEMEQLLESETLNTQACMERFKKLQEAQNRLATERFKLLVQVRELLGLDRFQTLKDEFKSLRMHRRHGQSEPAQRDENQKGNRSHHRKQMGKGSKRAS